MRFFSNTILSRASAVAALTLGCSVAACGGGDSTNEPGPDTGEEGGADSTTDARPDNGTDAKDTGTDSKVDTGTDTGHDTGTDTGHDTGVDSGVDTGTDTGVDTGIDTGTDTGTDTGVDTGTDTGVDTGIDAGTDTAICTPGTLCTDGTVCSSDGSTCNPCVTDTDCSIAPGTICFGDGTCKTAQCIPKNDATHCTAGQLCCSSSTSAGTCQGPATTGLTVCCDDTDCSGLTGTTSCDVGSHTCVCPAPTPGQLFVATTGSDATGNGSSSCPFNTIQKALDTIAGAPPAGAASVTVANGTYGPGCTGAACDASVIDVTTILNGLTIQGTTDSSTLTINSGFRVSVPTVSLTHMTIKPTGAAGIDYDTVAGTTEGSISDVTVLAASGLPAVRVAGGASPTIGPLFVASGGSHGVLITQSSIFTGSSRPTIVSSATGPTSIQGTSAACIRVETTATGKGAPPSLAVKGDPASPVHLTDCSDISGLGGIVLDLSARSSVFPTVSGFIIDRSATNPVSFTGVHLRGAAQATISGGTINSVAAAPGGGGIGILLEGSSFGSIGTVTVNGAETGVHIAGAAIAAVDGLTAINSLSGDGLLCDSTGVISGSAVTFTLRDSTFTGNHGNGVHVAAAGASIGCVADLGAAGVAANNQFNSAASRNLKAGLCYDSPKGPAASVSDSKWACTTGGGGGGCITATGGTNSPTTGPCSAAVDFSGGTEATLVGTQFCCD